MRVATINLGFSSSLIHGPHPAPFVPGPQPFRFCLFPELLSYQGGHLLLCECGSWAPVAKPPAGRMVGPPPCPGLSPGPVPRGVDLLERMNPEANSTCYPMRAADPLETNRGVEGVGPGLIHREAFSTRFSTSSWPYPSERNPTTSSQRRETSSSTDRCPCSSSVFSSQRSASRASMVRDRTRPDNTEGSRASNSHDSLP